MQLTTNKFIMVESSNLDSVCYAEPNCAIAVVADGDCQVMSEEVPMLVVRFARGDVYRYRNVPQSLVEELINAESVGKFFVQKVRSDFVAEKLNDVGEWKMVG